MPNRPGQSATEFTPSDRPAAPFIDEVRGEAWNARMWSTLVPVSTSSLLASALLAGRIYRSQTSTYSFLMWNLFLAWIPYLASLWAAYLHPRSSRNWWRLLLPGAVWLAFLPNGPYLVTDFWHLQEQACIPMWYDIGLLAAFAWTGLTLAAFSLRTMHRLAQQAVGSIVGWLFAAGAAGLAGLGIYLGRFLRWNSWDLVLNPKGVLTDVAVQLANPLQHPRTIGVTVLFAAMLFVCYLAFAAREPTA